MRLRSTKFYLQPNNTDFYYLCFGFVGLFVLWGLIIKFPILVPLYCLFILGLIVWAFVKEWVQPWLRRVRWF